MAVKLNVILLALATLCVSPAIAQQPYSAEQYLRNYALSTCIAQGYSSKEVKDDAAAAAPGYLEFGDYALAAHKAVRNAGQAFLQKKYPSQSGEPMTLAKCIDFYHSQELDKLVKTFKGKPDD